MQTVLERTPSVRDRLFCAQEQADALQRGPIGSPPWVRYLTGAFALKEAVAKAMGTGFREMAWQDIRTHRNASGKPEVLLAGVATVVATRLDIEVIHVSLTREGDQVTAIAIAECARAPQSGMHAG